MVVGKILVGLLLIASTVSGALGGGLGHITRNLKMLHSILANGAGSAIIGGGVTCVQNIFTGSNTNVLSSAIKSGLLGIVGTISGIKVVSSIRKINNFFARKKFNNLSLSKKLGAVSNAIERDSNYKPILIRLGITLGNIVSNLIGNLNQ